MGRIGQAALEILHGEGSVRMKRVRGMAVGFEARPSCQRLSQAQAVFKEPGVQCAEIRKPPKYVFGRGRCSDHLSQTRLRAFPGHLRREKGRGKKKKSKNTKKVSGA